MNQRIFLAKFLIISLTLFTVFFVVKAWQEPQLNPPAGNVPAPINVSATPQGKLGNLGIGIQTPISRFHIRDGQTWGTDLSLDAQGTTGGRRWLLISTGGTASEGRGKFLIKDNNANEIRLTIDTQGNIGIGTTTPASKLDIVGNLKVSDKTEVGRYVNWRLDQTSDPPDAPEGTIYYNKQSGVFRCKIPSGWVDCVNQGVLPPQDGPWVRIPNLDTGDPNKPTIIIADNINNNCAEGSPYNCKNSGWKSYILPRNVVKVRVRSNRIGNDDYWATQYSCGFHFSNYKFSGVIFTSQANPRNIELQGDAGSAFPGSLTNYLKELGTSIYNFCLVRHYNCDWAMPPSISSGAGPYTFDIAILPAGKHALAERGIGAGMYWNKQPGTTFIPAGTVMYMDMREITDEMHPFGPYNHQVSCTFEVMFQE